MRMSDVISLPALLQEIESLKASLTLERQFRKALTGDCLYAYEIDVTDNRFLRIDSNLAMDLGITDTCPYSTMLENVIHTRVPPEQQEHVRSMLSREALLESYRRRNRKVTVDYQRKTFVVSNWVRSHVAMVKDSGTGHVMACVYVTNINVQKKHEIRLVEKAQRDPLTKLYNRDASSLLINKVLRATDFSKSSTGHILICLDVDDFKGINDTYGHQAGDTVLETFADILKQVFRKSDIISRMGGDEFQVFMGNANISTATDRVQEVLNSLETTFTEFHVGSSIGIAAAPFDGTTLEELYANADAALYVAKQNGKNQYAVFGETA